MQLVDLLKENGGLYSGHTEFKNGFHGNGWVEKGFIIRNPKLLDEVTIYQAEKIHAKWPEIDLIVGPEVSGAIVASFVARHLKVELAVTIEKGENIAFHRIHKPQQNRNVCFIEDLVFTGTDTSDNIAFLKKYGMHVEGVSVWINRNTSTIKDVEVLSLANPPFEKYIKEECPLCKNNIALEYTQIRE